MDLTFLSQFIDANKLGGWVRAGVAAIIAAALGRWPLLATYLDPTVQQALGVAVAGIVVGVWSQLTKSDAAKIKAVAAMPDVQKIVVQQTATDGIGAALKDPTQTKVVSQ